MSGSNGAPTFDEVLAAISGAPVEERIRRWPDLQNRLLGAPVAESTAFIRAFLASGFIIPLNSGFVIGRDGSLLSAPDLRPLLLDTLDRIDPGAAVSEVRRILQSPDRPDDWAISLRIVASVVPPGDTYLEDRPLALLNVPE